MTLLQLGIGTVNDVVDARFDAGLKPGKPIPAGLVDAGAARLLGAGCFVAGTALAATVAPALALLAVVVAGIGFAYDLALKGTIWSWLPFAVGIPLLPVYGWLGARGGLPAPFAVLVPVAVAAGAALAIGNSLVDVERDVAAGRTSIAARLGRPRAARLTAVVFLLVAAVDMLSLGPWWSQASATVSVAGAAVAVVAASWAIGRPARAEMAWRIEAVSMAVAAIGWVAAVFA